MQNSFISPTILSVTHLNQSVRKLLESEFKRVWVEGEISNLSKPHSGHLYFTLKDQQAQVRCAMFRMKNSYLPFIVENGMHVLVQAKISLYEERGDYQLIVEQIEEKGEGLLRRRFELLKNQLAAEGLFDAIHKKPIPTFPKKIGIITSATGAAIRDVLAVLKRRFASIPTIIYPTLVQGELAAQQIVTAISTANQRGECDVLIICRGGGSLEDLFAFNEEMVARAIFASQLPIVSGIGHEIDFTIADFVADQRAPTPSAAAELLSPDKTHYHQRVLDLIYRLNHYIKMEVNRHKIQIDNYSKRLIHPRVLINHYAQNIDFAEQCLMRAMTSYQIQLHNKLQLMCAKLHPFNPIRQLESLQEQLCRQKTSLIYLIQQRLREARQHFIFISQALDMVSPLRILDRGYSMTTKNGHIVDDIKTVKRDDEVEIRVKNGALICIVKESMGLDP